MQGHGNASWTGTSNRKSLSNCFSRGHGERDVQAFFTAWQGRAKALVFGGKTFSPHFPHNFYPVTLPLLLLLLHLTEVCAVQVRQANPTGENNRSVGRAQAELPRCWHRHCALPGLVSLHQLQGRPGWVRLWTLHLKSKCRWDALRSAQLI